jgi:hypothetical protein
MELADSLKVNPFDPELIPQLESQVQAQISTGSYDFAINKALLKLYGAYPARFLVKNE